MMLSHFNHFVNLWENAWKVVDLRSDTSVASAMIGFNDKEQTVYLYYWGNAGNTIEWRDVISKMSDYGNWRSPTGNILLDPNTDESKWSGKRNRYSPHLKERVAILHQLGLAMPEAKVIYGNWASKVGTVQGTVSEILRKESDPAKQESLVLYHGTNTLRLKQVMGQGLTPQAEDLKSWKKERRSTSHRQQSVYLTADISQASYYAQKSVNVDRQRVGTAYGLSWFRQSSGPPLSPSEDYYWNAKQSGHKPKPVLLKVTIPSSAFDRLRVDDDYWNRQERDPSLQWTDSLTEFSQVAFEGTIPPEWIEVVDKIPGGEVVEATHTRSPLHTPPGYQLIGTCVSEDDINSVFGDIDTFEKEVRDNGDEFSYHGTTVTYDPRTHEHFFWKPSFTSLFTESGSLNP